MSVRILLADDHRIVREGLRVLLEREAGWQIVGEADDGNQVLEKLIEAKPDVVVMDVRMPGLNGMDATRKAVAAVPGIKVVCLSANTDQRTTVEMLRAGAVGYVVKESAFEELSQAIRTVLGGRVFLSASIARSVLNEIVQRPGQQDTTPFGSLSPREREVLQLISEGKSSKQIGQLLHVSVKTAETHRRNVMEKLKIDNVAELTKLAVREGLTSL